MTLRVRTHRGQQAKVAEIVDDLTVRDKALSVARFRLKRCRITGRTTDLYAAQRLVDWMTTEGTDRSVRFTAVKAAEVDVKLNDPIEIGEFLDMCQGFERFLLGERPDTPDRTAVGR